MVVVLDFCCITIRQDLSTMTRAPVNYDYLSAPTKRHYDWH